MLTWYAAQTNPRCEAKAVAGLKEHGFSTFLPVETKWKRSRSKARERVNTPLFTGYLFVGLCPGQSLYHVRQIDGVRGLVLCGQGVPAEINARFVYDLQARQAAGEFNLTRGDRDAPTKRPKTTKGEAASKWTELPDGEMVRVISGPFDGLIGQMVAADDQGRVALMLEAAFAGRVVIDDDQVEHLAAA